MIPNTTGAPVAAVSPKQFEPKQSKLKFPPIKKNYNIFCWGARILCFCFRSDTPPEHPNFCQTVKIPELAWDLFYFWDFGAPPFFGSVAAPPFPLLNTHKR